MKRAHVHERLWKHGAHALTDTELIAVLLHTGGRGVSAATLAQNLLRARHGIGGLAQTIAQPIDVPGLTSLKAARLAAAIELAKRLAKADLADRELLSRPDAVARYLYLRYSAAGQEIMGALYLDTRNRRIADRELFRGTLNRAAVEPRAILQHGLQHHAAAIILFHTHPSGDPTPSAEDLAFTRRVAEAGDLVGIHLVDHLILGGGSRWVSLRQRGVW